MADDLEILMPGAKSILTQAEKTAHPITTEALSHHQTPGLATNLSRELYSILKKKTTAISKLWRRPKLRWKQPRRPWKKELQIPIIKSPKCNKSKQICLTSEPWQISTAASRECQVVGKRNKLMI